MTRTHHILIGLVIVAAVYWFWRKKQMGTAAPAAPAGGIGS